MKSVSWIGVAAAVAAALAMVLSADDAPAEAVAAVPAGCQECDAAPGEVTGPSCAAPRGHPAEPAAPLSAAELAAVTDFAVARLVATRGAVMADLDAFVAEIESATGVRIATGHQAAIESAVVARLRAEHPEVLAVLGDTNRCSVYQACSLHSNLSAAGGEELAMYERERQQDGATFDDWELPSFSGLSSSGEPVTSDALRGRPTLLVFVAAHCAHSRDSLPILQALQKRYGERGLRVVAVYVNSGDARAVSQWLPLTFAEKPAFEVWVQPDAALGDVVGSHLVPTYLFVDGRGHVRRKLVGFKEQADVTERVEQLLAVAE